MNALTDIIYQLSTAMLAPVVATLLALFGWSLFTLGGFLREWQSRRRYLTAWSSIVARAERDGLPARNLAASVGNFSGLTASFVAAMETAHDRVPPLDKTLVDLEVQASGQLARMSFGVRLGPLLGLMGTLIPMGPALVGLSEGDIESMARNLVIVFSTTVVGVFIGGLCYGMLLVRRQWYARDLADIEFLIGRIASSCSVDEECHA